MAASHRAAKLAASSLQTPVNPSTGAQVAQYEREEPLEALGTEAVEEEKDEEEEKAVRPAYFFFFSTWGKLMSAIADNP
uniref:Uncharacterized protein n=1 Tax=Panthera leo TaxID=9689 RepID=A0A8C8WBJ8_PANLE